MTLTKEDSTNQYITELQEVHSKICKLENKKSTMYRERSRDVRELKVIPYAGESEFTDEIQKLQAELTDLWERKRELLGMLGDPFLMGVGIRRNNGRN